MNDTRSPDPAGSEPADHHALRRALQQRAAKVSPVPDLGEVVASAASSRPATGGLHRLGAVAAAVALVAAGAVGVAIGRGTAPRPAGRLTAGATADGNADGPAVERSPGRSQGAMLGAVAPALALHLTHVLTRTANGITLRVFATGAASTDPGGPVEPATPGSTAPGTAAPARTVPRADGPATGPGGYPDGCDPSTGTPSTLSPQTCALIGPVAPSTVAPGEPGVSTGSVGGAATGPATGGAAGPSSTCAAAGLAPAMVEVSSDAVATQLSLGVPVTGNGDVSATMRVVGVAEGAPFVVVLVRSDVSTTAEVTASGAGATDHAALTPVPDSVGGGSITALALPLPAGASGLDGSLDVSGPGGHLTLSEQSPEAPSPACAPPATTPPAPAPGPSTGQCPAGMACPVTPCPTVASGATGTVCVEPQQGVTSGVAPAN